MKSLRNVLGACLTAALLAACGGGNGLSSSAPMSVVPQITMPESGVTRGVLRRSAPSVNLYVANYNGGYVADTVNSTYPAGSKKLLRQITLTPLDAPQALAFDTSGNLYVANFDGKSVTVYASGSTTLLQTITQGTVRSP